MQVQNVSQARDIDGIQKLRGGGDANKKAINAL